VGWLAKIPIRPTFDTDDGGTSLAAMQKPVEIARRFNALTLRARILCAGGGALALLIIAFGGYKVYEHQATDGVGFVDADHFEIAEDTPIPEKKKLFFDTLRPIVEAENARVQAERESILAARKSGETTDTIDAIAEDYRVDGWTGTEWSRLLARVDTVPVTLALAQAANESSWGQSRFAQQGNNLFGEWCFTEGCGLVPQQRTEGKTHEVADYASVNHSVRSYIHNLNTGSAYAALRKLRQQARAAGQEPSAMTLASGLARYSERGLAYVNEIKSMIRANRDLMLGATDS